MATRKVCYPIVDLFAGPGGLGEGFANVQRSGNSGSVFKSVASIESDKYAHSTLLLRHFYRVFSSDKIPPEYYDYISGKISREKLQDLFSKEWGKAGKTALRILLGKGSHDEVYKLISARLHKEKKWALVGGPPCQAYSLVGRSRRANDSKFEEDKKHSLYEEYLKIIIDHRPPVFVMENVKGLVSAKFKGESVAEKIMNKLIRPKKTTGGKKNNLSYKLYSLSKSGNFPGSLSARDFVVMAEEYGIPQARHRIFIVGIRSDLNVTPDRLKKADSPCVKDVINDLPRIRSGVSKGGDSYDRWYDVLSKAKTRLGYKKGRYQPKSRVSKRVTFPKVMKTWYSDRNLKKISCHESRSHMESDLCRYIFMSESADRNNISPKLADFPKYLLPKHKNVEDGRAGKKFSDRFRVQLQNRVATTITSHISKDGHYFIHYDPSQCRSLTVREAARLQTFPDNYHFEGPRTQQYHQVGNAVPPYLAMKIGEIIADVLDKAKI